MQHPGSAAQADIELHPGRPRFAAERRASASPAVTRRVARVEIAALALVYVVSVASLAGFATFGLHPALLQRGQVSAEVYARILLIAPRAQILIALGALMVLLVPRTGARWVSAFL